MNTRARAWVLVTAALSLTGATGGVPAAAPAPWTNEPAPATPREFYNLGTAKLKQGDLSKAEQTLTDVLSAQADRLQPPALYNLGHVRFQQGVKELEKGPKGGAAADQGRLASQRAAQAIQGADQALADTDVKKLVDSYLRGRGARRELRSAMKAVKRAMDAAGNTLLKWRRASGDFKSAAELDPADEDARSNGDIVDRNIAKLVDSLRELQQMAEAMGKQQRELGEKMKQMKGRIPDEDAPPGAAGDDEEEEDQPLGPQPGQQEGQTVEGREMALSPEQAASMLDSYKLGERRLPMGQQETAEPKARRGEEY